MIGKSSLRAVVPAESALYACIKTNDRPLGLACPSLEIRVPVLTPWTHLEPALDAFYHDSLVKILPCRKHWFLIRPDHSIIGSNLIYHHRVECLLCRLDPLFVLVLVAHVIHNCFDVENLRRYPCDGAKEPDVRVVVPVIPQAGKTPVSG